MTTPTHELHICGELPKLHYSVNLIWCSAHQCWQLRSTHYIEDGCDPIEFVLFEGTDYGPFDTPNDVLRDAVAALTSMVGV